MNDHNHKLEVNPTTASSSTNHASPFFHIFNSHLSTYLPTTYLPTYKSTSYSFTASVRLRHCESPLSSTKSRTSERTNGHLPPHTSAYSYSIRLDSPLRVPVQYATHTHTHTLTAQRTAPHCTVLYCSKLIPSRHAQPSTAQHPPYCTYQLSCPALPCLPCPARELRQQAFESIDAQPAHQPTRTGLTAHTIPCSPPYCPPPPVPERQRSSLRLRPVTFVQTVVPSSNQQPGNQSLPPSLVPSSCPPPLLTFRCDYCCCSCYCYCCSCTCKLHCAALPLLAPLPPPVKSRA